MDEFIPEQLSLSLQLLIEASLDDKTKDQIIKFEFGYDEESNKDLHLNVYSIAELLIEENVGRVIRLIGYTGKIQNPVPYDLILQDGSIKRISTVKLTIQDIDGASILCPYIALSEFTEQFEIARKSKSLLIFEGTLVSHIDPITFRGNYFFFLKDIKTQLSPLDLLREREYNEDELRQKVEYFGKESERGIRGFIKEELVRNLNIKGLDKANHLDKAIDFMILQSLSRGMSIDGRYCNKLHSLIIGAPASGKKLLTIVAKILNPIAFEISSAASKVTPAGLIGRVKVKDNMIESSPGYLPLASHGIVCIQDFHELTGKSSKNDIFSILSKVMEDGEVEDSTSAKTTHKAITSIHLDMNRQSQVYNSELSGTYEDIGIPKNVLSRFDFIMEIPANIQRQFEIVLDIAGSETVLVSGEHNYSLPEWAGRLRRIVAYMATKYDASRINDDMAGYIKERLKIKLEEKIEYKDFNTVNEIVSTRIAISLQKFAKAIACSKLKTIVEIEDIDEAFDYLDYKLSFLANYKDFDRTVDKRSTDKQSRSQMILKEFNGKKFTKKDVLELLEKNGISATLRTIDRDIDEMLDGKLLNKVKHGLFEIVNG